MPMEQSPNMRKGREADGLSSYHRAMVVAFASYRRWAPTADLRYVSDAEVPEAAREAFDDLGVQLMLVPFTHRPPSGFSQTFNASLFALDAAAALCAAYPSESIALLDPDCLAVSDLTPLFERARTSVCVYPTGFPPTEVSNGLSAEDAAGLHATLDPRLTGVPVHYGGECYAFTADLMVEVLAHAERAYDMALSAADSELKFTTEEHVFNFALRYAGIDEVDDLVRRIWTAPRYRTVSGDEDGLTLWHLPAEKDRGFARLAPVAVNRSSWFWTAPGDRFRLEAGRLLGIGRRPLGRYLYDQLGGLARKVQARIR